MATKTHSGLKIRLNYEDSEGDPGISCPEPGAKQSEKDSCDVNLIVARHSQTGLLEHVVDLQAAYGDFSSVDDYQTSLNKIMAAEEAFMELPAQVRSRFANDPAQLLGFLQDPSNRSEAEKLGLITPKPAQANALAPETLPGNPPSPK